jgi:hypothetical protein
VHARRIAAASHDYDRWVFAWPMSLNVLSIRPEALQDVRVVDGRFTRHMVLEVQDVGAVRSIDVWRFDPMATVHMQQLRAALLAAAAEAKRVP